MDRQLFDLAGLYPAVPILVPDPATGTLAVAPAVVPFLPNGASRLSGRFVRHQVMIRPQKE